MQGTSTTPDAPHQSSLPASEKMGWAKAIAILTIVLGLIVLSGWAWDIDALKRVLPGLVSMKANTAAAFALSGIALYLHTLRQNPPAILLIRRITAFLVLLLGLATLSEYFFGWNIRIDQLLFRESAGEVLTSNPGRMSTITATSFALIGSVLLLMEARFWIAAQALASAVAIFAFLPLSGYMFGNLSFTQIGNTTAIAAHTAAGFLMLAVGALVATQNYGFMVRLQKKSLVIGLATSLLMLILIFSAASYNFVQKDKASQWVEQTYEIIQSMESFSNSLHDFLYHNRGFLITGDDHQLTERDKAHDTMLLELARAHRSFSNPVQKERLAALDKLVQQRVDRADMMVRLRREKGSEAVATMVRIGQGDILTDEIEAKLDELEDTEKKLLKERQRVAEIMRSSSLFTLGILATASLLLLLWVFRASQHEIVERKQSEAALKESEEQFRTMAEAMPQIVWMTRPDGWNIYFNRQWADYTGMTLEESYGHGWNKPFHPDDQQRAWDAWQHATQTDGIYSLECRLRRKDGVYRWWLIRGVSLHDADGKVVKWIGTCTNIEEIKQAETALNKSEKRLHAIIETSMDAIVQMDANGIIAGWNSQMENIFGWTQAEAIGRALHETIIPPQHREAHLKGLKNYLLTGEGAILNKRIEVMGLHRNGNIFPVELTVTPIKIEDRYEFSAFLRNITERKRHENIQLARLRLMESAARLPLKELLIATLDEACALTGSCIGFYHFLEADQKTLSLQAWSTRTIKEFCKAEGEGAHYDIADAGVWVDCVRERRPVIHNDYATLPHKRGLPPGHAHVEREMVVPIFRKESIVAILGVGNKATPYEENDLESVTQLADLAWDIADAKRAGEEVHRLNAELEQRVVERTARLEAANKDMESFSYSISHDLRAPLRAINGFSKILQEEYVDRLDDEGKRLLNVVGDNAQKMGQLIDDILAFSRAGRNEINRSVINMESMVAGVWEELKPGMIGRNVHLDMRGMPSAEGDAAMIHQVVLNLLSNAVKFTQHRADARIEVGGQAGEHETVYHVKDNGVGFDMQYAEKLFGVFLRLHGMDEFEGTGIGLAIVKRIITKHGGRVWAEGKVGEGATFYFSLPMGKN